MDNMEAFVEVLEMSAAAQSAVRLPLNLSTATKVGDNRYRKELLRVGEIVVNSAGKKFNFTSEFLKDMKNNFKKVLDYVPLLFVDPKTNEHTVSANPKDYGGVVEELSVDDENNPTKLYGTLRLTEETEKMVEHNPQFGVSVTAHPHFVDAPRATYVGPTLLNVAATHYPKLNRLGGWERVAVDASNEHQEFEVIDLSMHEFSASVNDTRVDKGKEGEETMPEKETNGNLELSQEQITALLEHPDVKGAIANQVSSAVAEKDQKIVELSNQVGEIKSKSYENAVNGAVNSYVNSGVPPVMLDTAKALMLSFDADERNEKIELSVGEGDEAKTLELSKIEMVTKLLDEAKGFVDLSGEKGEAETDPVQLSKEQEDEAVNFLTSLAGGE